MGLVSRHVLLGRIGESDELSCDLINWRPLSAWPALMPAIMKADSADPLVQERLQAARRWADERSALTRRQAQEPEPVARERRHLTPERRQAEPEEELQHRSAHHLPAASAAGNGGYSHVYGGLIAMGLLLVVTVVIVMVPGKQVADGSDCTQPPAPGVNWSNCFKEGLVLKGGDLSGAVMKNMKLSRANLSGGRLQGADLSYTELSVALLRTADLRNALLIGASLRGADLRNADLRQANLA
ncbi:MAG: pentapeptide repeat-containing protein, partial [Gammaproteobacteria bacterium]